MANLMGVGLIMVHAKTAAAECLHRKRQSRAARRRWRRPEYRARAVESFRRVARTPEGRRIRAAVARGGWADNAVRQRRLEQLARARATGSPMSRFTEQLARAANLPPHVADVVAKVAMGVISS